MLTAKYLIWRDITLPNNNNNNNNKINDPILNLTPENITQHSGIEWQLHT